MHGIDPVNLHIGLVIAGVLWAFVIMGIIFTVFHKTKDK